LHECGPLKREKKKKKKRKKKKKKEKKKKKKKKEKKKKKKKKRKKSGRNSWVEKVPENVNYGEKKTCGEWVTQWGVGGTAKTWG